VVRVLGAEDGSARTPAAGIWPGGRGRPSTARLAATAREPAPLPIELEALRGLIDPALLEAAAARAERIGVGGDEVLRAHGIVSADELVAVLARRLRLPIDRLDDDAPSETSRVIEAPRAAMLARSRPDDPLLVTVAPRGLALRRLAGALREQPALRAQLRIASPERLSAYARRVGAAELAHAAAHGLADRYPEFSAAVPHKPARGRIIFFGGAAALMGGLAAAGLLFFALEAMLGLAFLAWITLRLNACLSAPVSAGLLDLPPRHLPVYTIVVPLYQEAHMVDRLVAALERLDYPREKLDIKLVVEADDTETRAAVARRASGPRFEVIVAPPGPPRTKPKALAAALPFARGAFLVVYDAEDEPEADQLQVALAAFRKSSPQLACVQARLAIDNAADNWLTRQFTAEYAGLFEVFLPALAELGVPLPLGGTSNHFRTETLRRVGGWDPFNVTEDADIGIRLARFGYRTGVIASTTWEEAPGRFGAWLRQRTRWFKGWLQTWTVHMRAPRRLRRELGWGGFLAFQLIVGGTVLAALVHPFFLALVIGDLWSGVLAAPSPTALDALHKGLTFTTLLSGYLCSAALGVIGLARRRMLGGAWVLVTIPIYWLLLSLAAWRALFQFVIAPYHWEKTEHGLARTSRRAGARERPHRVVRTVTTASR
jgi:cellulose synthase/poly-beta-1,6-N-acetylglucosamine synthase-like glycosyltransferase